MRASARPRAVFSEPLFNLGQQAAAAAAESERARQSVAAAGPRQLPGGAHYAGEISNHELFTPALPSLLLPAHAASMPGRPAACLPLSASFNE